MNKKSPAFIHDSDAHSDPKVVNMMLDLKAEGYGIYWVIIEMLRTQKDQKMPFSNCLAIAYQAHAKVDIIEKVIKNYMLFEFDQKYFWSESLIDRVKAYDIKCSHLRVNAQKGGLAKAKHLLSKSASKANITKAKLIEAKETKEAEEISRYENMFFGNVPADLINLAQKLEVKATAQEWHVYVEDEIKKLGYKTSREVECHLPTGELGKIDLVVTKENIKIAIELDYRTSRVKSIEKVKTYNIGIILLREPRFKKEKFLNDETFLRELKRLYHWVNLDVELAKMDAWLLTKPGRQKTRGFIVNWLNKVDKPLVLPKKIEPKPTLYETNPQNQAEVSRLIKETLSVMPKL